jgi:N-acylneuraminate cytidylyltransferase
MNIAIIPARLGSKRLPQKNIKKFLGKSLICYSIEAAKKTKIFDKIIVSTESTKIKKIAEMNGAEVPFLRPNALANDRSHFNEAVIYTINRLEKNNERIKNVCCIYPTSPLINPRDIIKGFNILKKSKSYVFSACKYISPPQRSFYFHKQQLKLLTPKNYHKRSQDLKTTYHDAGQFYWGRTKTWIKDKVIFNKNSKIVEIDYLNFMDINYLEDFNLAMKLYKTVFSKNEK